jgi:hypothetical protein
LDRVGVGVLYFLVVVGTAIATAVIVSVGLDVVASAIGADKVVEKAHLVYSVWLVWV